jgi:hypothetical protein
MSYCAWQKERSMSDIDQVILELKCLGEVAEVNGMTVEGNALHPIINMGWQALELLRAEVARLKEELAEYEKHDAARDEKIRSLTTYHGLGCACSYDNVDDVCEHHSPKLMALTQQLAAAKEYAERLRDAIEPVIRISDRKHDAWDAAKAAIALPMPWDAIRKSEG